MKRNPNRGITIFFTTFAVVSFLLGGLMIAAELAGSSRHWGTHHPENAIQMRDMIQSENMGQSQILEGFGKPDVTQSFTNEYRQTEDVWYYKFSDGNMQITFQYGRIESVNIW